MQMKNVLKLSLLISSNNIVTSNIDKDEVLDASLQYQFTENNAQHPDKVLEFENNISSFLSQQDSSLILPTEASFIIDYISSLTFT
ncbi:hypothetical protein CEXT_265191 [Caerostris extrusa]|uniref:Uncharacterized protein n=1 Tax=Caerostris extrusa TaxID=172846 RepID=A0AAV4NA80_CAEEX|nr:hypothetical protein CEXT_265191 [Caerostris extrusa]